MPGPSFRPLGPAALLAVLVAVIAGCGDPTVGPAPAPPAAPGRDGESRSLDPPLTAAAGRVSGLLWFAADRGAISCIATDAPGEHLLTGSLDGTATVRNRRGEVVAHLARHGAPVLTAAFAPQGDLVATASSDGTARIFDLHGVEVSVLRGHRDAVSSVLFAPSGDRVLTASLDGTARLWDAAGRPVATVVLDGLHLRDARFAGVGTRWCALADDGTARVFDGDGRQLIVQTEGSPVRRAALTHDGGSLVAVGTDGSVRVRDVDAGTETLHVEHGAEVIDLDLHRRDGLPPLLATASLDGTALILDCGSGARRLLEGHRGGVHSVAFSPAADRVLTVSSDRRARVFGADGTLRATWGDEERKVEAAWWVPGGVLVAHRDGVAAGIWRPEAAGGEEEYVSLGSAAEDVAEAVVTPAGFLTLDLRREARWWPTDVEEAGRLAAQEAPAAGASGLPPALQVGDVPLGDALPASGCVDCHRKEYAAWRGSAHARSVEPAGPESLPTAALRGARMEHPPGATTFGRSGSRYLATTTGPDGELHDYHLTHMVGRLRVRMFVATLEDGRLQVLPGMLEEPTNRWFDYTHLLFGPDAQPDEPPPVVAPGEASFWTGAARSYDQLCARCHSSGKIPRDPGPSGAGPRSLFRSVGVDCDTCHGPGRAHAVAWRRTETGGPMPHLATLDRDASISVCTRCHMEGRVVRAGFVPGDDVLDRVTPTLLDDPARVDPAGRPLELIYDGLPFGTSTCAAAGGLRCTDCHDPHGSHEQRSMLRRPPGDGSLCVRCHEDLVHDSATHSHHDPAGSGSRCVACHLPFLTIERGHGAVADHTIGSPRPDLAGRRVATDACTWCHTGGLGAPEGAPPLDRERILESFAAWWPVPMPRPRWMDAVAASRADRPDAGGLVAEVLADRSLPRLVRGSLAGLLASHAGSVPDAVAAAARDGDDLVRRKAMAAAAGLEDPEAIPLLLAGLGDPSPAVRSEAAVAALAGWKRVRERADLRAAVLTVLEQDAAAVPDAPRRWFRLGAVRGMAGDDIGSIGAYERMLELDPHANAVRSHLERLRARVRKERAERLTPSRQD